MGKAKGSSLSPLPDDILLYLTPFLNSSVDLLSLSLSCRQFSIVLAVYSNCIKKIFRKHQVIRKTVIVNFKSHPLIDVCQILPNGHKYGEQKTFIFLPKDTGAYHSLDLAQLQRMQKHEAEGVLSRVGAQLFFVGQWRNNALDGPSKSWQVTDDNLRTVLTSCIQFKNGEKEGDEMHWFQAGGKRYHCTNRRGLIDGKETNWYLDGQIASTCTRKSGVKEGVELSWDKSGSLSASSNWQNGKKIGEEKHFHPDSALKFICTWKKGVLEGDELHFYNNGQKSYSCKWMEGEKEGYENEWYRTGVQKYSCKWKNGSKDDQEIHWWESGEVKFQLVWKNGQPNSVEEHFLANGKRKMSKFDKLCKSLDSFVSSLTHSNNNLDNSMIW